MSDKQDFEAVRGALTFESLEHGTTIGQISTAAFAALSRIEAVQKLATEQVEWLQRTKKEAVAQRDALKAALEELRDEFFWPSVDGVWYQRTGSPRGRKVLDRACQALQELEEK